MSIDPVEQDTREYHDKLANYNKAIEAMIPVVKEDYTFFESFLMDEYPDIYNEIDDLEAIHTSFLITNSREGSWNKIYDKWMEYVEDEAKRRVEG